MIEYVCFTNHTGYATAAKANLEMLIQSGREVAITPLDLGFDKRISSQIFDPYSSKRQPANFYPDLQIVHAIPDMQRRARKARRRIGYATFECEPVPARWIALLNANDAVIAPSIFNVNIFKNAGVTVPIFHVPHALNFSLISSSSKTLGSQFGPSRYPEFKFLFFGTWKNRKNYEGLLRAFFEEFNNEPIELYIKTSFATGSNPQAFVDKLKREYKKNLKIRINTTLLKDSEVIPFISKFDCYVSPTLGEGFGLPALQAMSANVPVIITHYSGVLDFCNDENSIGLKPEGMITRSLMDGLPQFTDCKWPYISINQIRQKLRLAYEDRDLLKRISQKAYNDAKVNFDYPIISQKLFNVIDLVGIP